MAKYKITLHIEDDGGWYDNKPDLLIQTLEESIKNDLDVLIDSIKTEEL
jgi:hypothetical protein